ncbi:MAG TPA: ATP synthase F0 subunit B [Terriglobales bacterium]|jgi:F-type H+-transporting ATPase subunit b|nr:ATP synthase F0 subunit B [Terriglobales bacterium]
MDATLRQLGELALGAIPTIILFVFTWILYRVIVHNALASALAERRSKTVGAAEKAKADIAAAERKAAEYEAKVRDARLAVFKRLEKLRQQILEHKTVAIAEARVAAEGRVNAARAEIMKETEIAKALVHSEASALAQEIIRAILRTGAALKEPAVGGRR